MTLAEFLADYLDSFDGGSAYGATGDVDDLTDSIQAGIQKFVKDEHVQVAVRVIKTDKLAELYTGQCG